MSNYIHLRFATTIVLIWANTLFAQKLVSFCHISPKIDSANIDFKGAQEGAELRISNLQTPETLTLSEAVHFKDRGIIIKAEISDGIDILGPKKTVKAYQINIKNGVLVIKSLLKSDKAVIPDISTIICFAAINPDGKIAYLVNGSNHGIKTVRKKTAKHFLPGDYRAVNYKAIKRISLPDFDLDNENIIDAVEKFNRLDATQAGNILKIHFAFIRPYVEKEKKAKVDDDDDELGDLFAELEEDFQNTNEKGENVIDKKLNYSRNTVTINRIIADICKLSGTYYQTTFWGVGFSPIKSSPEYWRSGTNVQVIKKYKKTWVVQDINNPGVIASIEPKMMSYAGQSSLAGESKRRVFYHGVSRSHDFMMKLYNQFREKESTCFDLDVSRLKYYYSTSYTDSGRKKELGDELLGKSDRTFNRNNSRSSSALPDILNNLLASRKKLDTLYKTRVSSNSYSAFIKSINLYQVKLQMICPSCSGKGHSRLTPTRKAGST